LTTYDIICPTLKPPYPFKAPPWVDTVISMDGEGIGRARNRGATYSSADWLIFVDDDTELCATCAPPPDHLQMAVPYYLPAWFGAPYEAGFYAFANFLNAFNLGPLVLGPCVAIRRECFKGYLENDVAEDVQLGMDAFDANVNWGMWDMRANVYRAPKRRF